MIEISVENKIPCIYKIEDWETLRNEHRIVGVLLGSNFRTPSLPLKLLPEEALFLVDRGTAKLVIHPKLKNKPTQCDKEKCNELKDELLEEQRVLYRDVRKRQMESIIDKIVEGKKKRGDERTHEEILDEELNKSCNVSEDNMLWPTLLQHSDCINGTSVEVKKDDLMKQTTVTRLKVFTDLWEKGYYITAGHKFGGDFLIYLGDPIMYHAVGIVRCVEDIKKQHHPSELVAFGRLGTSVKKRAILAALEENETVSYITLNWIDA